jgi:predicted nucleic acid-binding protein
MKVVVDSNIVFSAILNTKGKIGQLIINGSKYFDYYSIGLLKDEIIEHKEKILNISGFSIYQFEEIYRLIINRIKFVDDILLTEKDIQKSIDLVEDIDIDDAMFIALNNHLSANLWTGDKKLINGLLNKGYSRIVTTNDLYDIFLLKQIKKAKKRK